MNIDMTSIGNRIKNRRKELKLTQTDIYNICGIASGALSQIENGTRTPSILIFYTIAQVLNCNMEWLVTGSSTNADNFTIYENEETLVKGFRKLPEDEQNELIKILELKLQKIHETRKTTAKSSHSTGTDNNTMVG